MSNQPPRQYLDKVPVELQDLLYAGRKIEAIKLALLLCLGSIGDVGLAADAAGEGNSFAAAIHERAAESCWLAPKETVPLTRKILVDSIELARGYYLGQQLPEGNFTYRLNVTYNLPAQDDNQVRQAGALWGLTSLLRDQYDAAAHQAAVRGLDFYFRISRPLNPGHIAPIYPDAEEVNTGTVALLSLALVEMCRGPKDKLAPAELSRYQTWLDTYLHYLQYMELDDGSWGQRYVLSTNQRDPKSSPYYNGETLLLYCKAARYMGHTELIPKIEKAALRLAERYTVKAWERDPASEETRNFGQRGCLAFAEYVEAGWPHADTIGDAALALAWWLVHVHEIESRRSNTAYAVEGLLGACRVARQRGDTASMQTLRPLTERILVRLIGGQIGGPLPPRNASLVRTTATPKAVGGFLSGEDTDFVRIDVVQHQVHAMLMALELFYPEQPPPAPPPAQKAP